MGIFQWIGSADQTPILSLPNSVWSTSACSPLPAGLNIAATRCICESKLERVTVENYLVAPVIDSILTPGFAKCTDLQRSDGEESVISLISFLQRHMKSCAASHFQTDTFTGSNDKRLFVCTLQAAVCRYPARHQL